MTHLVGNTKFNTKTCDKLKQHLIRNINLKPPPPSPYYIRRYSWQDLSHYSDQCKRIFSFEKRIGIACPLLKRE